jgi:molybdopterin-containing oxidoreductase family membrane subunit
MDLESLHNNGTEKVIKRIKSNPHKLWYWAISISIVAFFIGIWAVYQTVYYGIGTWGLNNTVGWGWGITNFVWWIGIGHAGTFISAILLLFKQEWRIGINRAAEAMTIFAVICAGFFPIIHMGRALLFFFTVPYPNTRSLWVNFNSPLIWDVFAITTYFLVSLLFWYSGLLPDIAVLRDRARNRISRVLYRFFSLGWVNSARRFWYLERFSFLMAAIAAPLVISVHSIVSYDFATSIIPGWHSTILPPYFVAGALYSGFAMVLTLMIIARKTMKLENFIRVLHVEKMNRILLITGTIVGIAYFIEIFTAFYSGNEYEIFLVKKKLSGSYAIFFWLMILFNLVLPQLLWINKLRTNINLTFIFSILINFGMWLERYVIVVGSLETDFLPANWQNYMPSEVEIALFVGTLGLFFSLFLIFVRVLPVVSVWENSKDY